ncbi:uncharacterized protein LOC111636823 [Centruroides sculpturatus]|uniref:uncharacterized protein LOC111636823 n=1 Tax=Centruroides sculpturatus TaxID=218467 RepID=UPI000C6D7677|nr:uncharacterized protein LOC111636823 [Centruroides sculpturatus]
MEGHSIKVEKEIKYLGVVLDHRLTWMPHATYVRTVGANLFNALARAAKANWGHSKEAIAIIYKGAFIPKVTYAAGAWYKAAEKGSIKRKLRSAQRTALLRMTRAYRTTSTEALMVIAGTTPIDMILREKAKAYMCRRGYSINIKNETYKGTEYEMQATAMMLPRPYNRMAINIATKEDRSDIDIYTDGFKVEGQVGASFLVIKDNEEIYQDQFRLDDRCSVYQAELFAILQTIRWVISTRLSGSIIINTDSSAAIHTLKQFNDKNMMAFEAKKLIEEYGLKIKIRWVKAHIGIAGNKKADALAKEAASLTETTYNKIPISYIKRLLRQESIDEWQEEWSYSMKGRHTFWLLPNIEERINDLRWLSSDFITTQLLTNHCNTKEYLKRIGKQQDTQCECGKGEHSLDHVINECTKYEMERIQLLSLVKGTLDISSLDLYMIIRARDLVQEVKTFTRTIMS